MPARCANPALDDRYDIADYLGLTNETVSRSFRRMKNNGVISEPSPNLIRIEDVDKLMRLADGCAGPFMVQSTMLRNSATIFTLLAFCVDLNAAPARSTETASIKSDAKGFDIWADGFAESASDKIIGLALRLSGPLRFGAKASVQQHADPHLADSEKVDWSIATPAEYHIANALDLNVSSGGALDSLNGSYIQSLTGALAWTARSTSELTSKLQLKSNLPLDVGKASSTLVVGPEWSLRCARSRRGPDPAQW